MIDPSTPLPTPSTAAAAVSLARRVTVTWWYTAASIVVILLATLFVWAVAVHVAADGRLSSATVILFAGGTALSTASTVVLLGQYRSPAPSDGAADQESRRPDGFTVAALAAAAAAAAMLGIAATSTLLAGSTLVLAFCLLRWAPGIRLRVVLLLTAALVVLAILDNERLPDVASEAGLPHPIFAVMIPGICVLSLWWWDVVRELDRARATESRLGAAQERLRLASDLHDLQGHHLQVIALQLELADRMIARDPAAAAEQVRLARHSVDEARRGTRDLAERFRGVPLPDELANAADLLRAAGLQVRLGVSGDADEAPADVLGPVVRECTTNVLKHGGGSWARLGLRRDGTAWRFEISNDADADSPPLRGGSGLAGIANRVGAVGGSAEVGGEPGEFRVVVTVPTDEVPAQAGRTGGEKR